LVDFTGHNYSYHSAYSDYSDYDSTVAATITSVTGPTLRFGAQTKSAVEAARAAVSVT